MGCRYIHLFRSRLPKQKLLAAFPTVMRLLQSDSNVVHSYAAIVIERLLALRVPSAPAAAAAAAAGAPAAAAAGGMQMYPLLVPADVSGHLQQLLELLFAALRKEDSTENEYVMRALMRVIVFVGAQIIPVAQLCLDLYASPTFSRTLFTLHAPSITALCVLPQPFSGPSLRATAAACMPRSATYV